MFSSDGKLGFPVSSCVVQFPDEKWLDHRRLDLVAPIMLDRLDTLQAKGCDAVEWDNADLPVQSVSLRFTRWPIAFARSALQKSCTQANTRTNPLLFP